MTHESQQHALYGVTQVLSKATSLETAAPEILRLVCEVLHWDVGVIWHIDHEAGVARSVDLWRNPSVEIREFAARTRLIEFPAGVGLPGRVWATNQPHWLEDVVSDPNFPRANAAAEGGLKSGFAFPIRLGAGVFGVMEFFSRKSRPSDDGVLALFDSIGSQIGQFMERLRAEEWNDRITAERLYLEEEIQAAYAFDIAGETGPLKPFLESIRIVAQTDATVLISGEPGTGHELIARSLHEQSQRKTKTFVKLNCSTNPPDMFESKLFGGEGFGRLELANKGTLFLEQIGDLPLSLQPKLLRALQEHEFERPGSTQTRRVDIRLIASSNRDLHQMVSSGTFRSDLFYRLSVFPIHVPPLRNRSSDIPDLVRHFVQKCATRINRQIDSIPESTMRSLQRWHWPGNLQELENFIERAVILTSGSVLDAPLAELRLIGGKGRNWNRPG